MPTSTIAIQLKSIEIKSHILHYFTLTTCISARYISNSKNYGMNFQVKLLIWTVFVATFIHIKFF